jgi:nucleoside-diphosphate-sugar epimerase
MPQRSWDTTIWVADSARIRAELGWEPRTSLEQGLVATAEWLKAAGAAIREKYTFRH